MTALSTLWTRSRVKQTRTAMREIVVGKIDCWDRRGGFAFAQTADGTRFFLSALELSRAGIQRLDIGDRVRFVKRLATARGRAPWGVNVEVRR